MNETKKCIPSELINNVIFLNDFCRGSGHGKKIISDPEITEKNLNGICSR